MGRLDVFSSNEVCSSSDNEIEGESLSSVTTAAVVVASGAHSGLRLKWRWQRPSDPSRGTHSKVLVSPNSGTPTYMRPDKCVGRTAFSRDLVCLPVASGL
jgi:hypothetical protein